MFNLKNINNIYEENFLLDDEDFYNRAEMLCDKTGLNNKMSLMINTVAYDSYSLAKYNALNFEEFKNYLFSKNLLENGNNDVRSINTWLIKELSNNYVTIMNSLAYRNIGFAMRVIRKSFTLIIKGIILNLSDSEGNYLAIDSFKNFCKKQTIFSDVENFIDGSLIWAKEAAIYLNKDSHVIDSIDKDNLTIEVLVRLLALHDLKPALANTKQFLSHSITELFSNTKNPTIEYYFLPDEDDFNYLGRIEKEYMENSIVSEVFVFQTLSCLVESTLEYINILELSQKDVDSFNYYLDIILSCGDEDEELDNLQEEDDDDANLYDEGFISSNEMEYPFDVRYNDSLFFNILKGNNKMSIEEINSYFVNYRNKYLVSSDVISCEDTFHKMTTTLAYKYLNIFRSLLIGMRFYKTQFNPDEVCIKDSSFVGIMDKIYDNKIIFDSTEFERMVLNDDELKSNILLVTLIQHMVNICNSIISDDISSSLVEMMSLYEMAVMKIYINFMGDNCLNNFLDECFFLSQKNIQDVKIFEELLDELEDYQPLSQESEKQLIEQMEENGDFKQYDYPSPFDFAPNNIHGISDIVQFLNNKVDIDLEVIDKNNLFDIYNIINNPFEIMHDDLDLKLSKMLLGVSQMIVSSLKCDPLFEINENMKTAMDICESLIQFDLRN